MHLPHEMHSAIGRSSAFLLGLDFSFAINVLRVKRELKVVDCAALDSSHAVSRIADRSCRNARGMLEEVKIHLVLHPVEKEAAWVLKQILHPLLPTLRLESNDSVTHWRLSRHISST